MDRITLGELRQQIRDNSPRRKLQEAMARNPRMAEQQEAMWGVGELGLGFTEPAGTIMDIIDSFSSNPTTAAFGQLGIVAGGVSGRNLRKAKEAADKGILAFHGTGHEGFDKFDSSKIGTGEGGAAFGHGIYFTEQEKVAKEYRKQLTVNRVRRIDQKVFVDGKPVSEVDAYSDLIGPVKIQLARVLSEPNINGTTASRFLEDAKARFMERVAKGESAKTVEGLNKEYDRAIEFTKSIKKISINKKPPKGSIFKVNIKAGKGDLLDLDSPLSGQSNSVRKAIEKLAADPKNIPDTVLLDIFLKSDYARHFPNAADVRQAANTTLEISAGNQTAAKQWADKQRQLGKASSAFNLVLNQNGSAFYAILSRKLGSAKAASEALREAGVPGIKYLDQMSRYRSGGEILGTSHDAGKWTSKIRVQGRSGGVNMPVQDLFTTSPKFDTEDEAYEWAAEQVKVSTHNFVVFDDKTIDILKKYGFAGLASAGLVSRSVRDEGE